MKKHYYLYSLLVAAIAILSMLFTACGKEEETQAQPYKLYNYRGTIEITSIRPSSELFYCTHTEFIEWDVDDNKNIFLGKHMIHSNECMEKHLAWQPDEFQEADWNQDINYMNNYWMWNRKDIVWIKCTLDYNNSRITLENGEIYLMGINDENEVDNLVNESTNQIYVAVKDFTNFKP